MIRAGFEYQLILFADDEKAHIGPQTEPALVQ
jgi:hypothetical protein